MPLHARHMVAQRHTAPQFSRSALLQHTRPSLCRAHAPQQHHSSRSPTTQTPHAVTVVVQQQQQQLAEAEAAAPSQQHQAARLQQQHAQVPQQQLRSASPAAGAAMLLATAASAMMHPAAAAALTIHTEPANALSLPTWAIHVSSVTEWVAAMALFWKYAEVTGNPRWKGMTWGMMPSLGSAMAACTWHFFYNSPDLDFLVALQAFLTVVGNCTCWFAAWRIYTAAQAEQGA